MFAALNGIVFLCGRGDEQRMSPLTSAYLLSRIIFHYIYILGAEAYSSGLANYDFLCTNLCSSLAGLVGAWAFKEADLVASCVKPGFPSPNKMEQKKMFVQAHLMIGMAQTNQQMYGTMNYVSVSFSNVDYYLFPMNDNGNIVLAVACVKPYSIEVISKAVSELIA